MKNCIKVLWIVCLVVFVFSILVMGLHFLDIFVFPDLVIRIVGVLCMCAILGYSYSTMKMRGN